MATVHRTDDDDALFARLEAYPWPSDVEFQNGLQAILGPSPIPEQVERLTLRARKHSVSVDFPAYLAWYTRRASRSASAMNGSASRSMQASVDPPTLRRPDDAAPPYPMTFNTIVGLISSGQPIPGIKEIPDTLLEGQGTQPSQPARKKPWERRIDQRPIDA